MKKIYCVFLLLAMAGIASSARAQDLSGLADMADDSAMASEENIEKDKKKLDFSFHGFVRTNFVAGKDDNFYSDNFYCKKIGTILQLQIEAFASSIAHLYTATNFEFNLVDFTKLDDDLNNVEEYMDPEPRIKVIEAYIDIYPSRWMSIRSGKQIITWGEIEGIEAPTDILTPWDYTTKSSVFEDSRMGNVAIAFNFFFVKQKLELVWIPIFQPSKMEAQDIRKKGEEISEDGIYLNPPIVPSVERPDYNLKNCEYAVRLSGDVTNWFRYGLAFLYGFNDLPDSDIAYSVDSFGQVAPSTVDVNLIYTRIMVPAVDLAFNVKDLFSIKTSAVAHITEDLEAERDDRRNSDIMYLFGPESTNIGFDIYFALYMGQMWVINYTNPHYMRKGAVPYNLLQSIMMLKGFDQFYRYKWVVSGLIQRNFLTSKNLEIGIRYALSASPEFDEIDYTVNLNMMYKLIDNLSITAGLIMADKIGIIKNMVILELQYSF